MMFNKTTASMALVFGLFFFLGVSGAVGKFTQVDLFQKLTPVPPTETDQALEEAFRKSVQQKRNQVLGFQVFEVVIDHIQYAADKSTALIWIALRDPQSGEVIASEPGLAIAYSASPNDLGNPDNWTIVQQVDEGFTNGLEMLPKELLTESVLNQYLTPRQEPGLSAIAALHGYKLPWTAGLAKRVIPTVSAMYILYLEGWLPAHPPAVMRMILLMAPCFQCWQQKAVRSRPIKRPARMEIRTVPTTWF